ncbi:hypothetical protein [Roseibium aggregatum]|uniref:hypothetical protein n=1 Tax=Roseibium aggregatum TaxID=187304 RepID=UPI0006E2CE80|nr:hypothetical protein [Roseibium aggregatum]MCR9282286.1 hypothetical protein [Paracoccaceae bacterium]
MAGYERNSAQDPAPTAWNARNENTAPPEGAATIFTFYACLAILATLAALGGALFSLTGSGQ